jgi:hypothetical protein
MPAGDRTGPMGRGPMTGGAAGYCAGYPAPGYANPVIGRGFGWDRGHRWRRWFYAIGLPAWARFGNTAPAWGYGPDAPPAPEQETKGLKAQAEWLKDQLDAINRRIDELREQ